MSFTKYIVPIVGILTLLLGITQYFFPNSSDFLSTALPRVSSFIGSLNNFTSGLGPIIGSILFYVTIFAIILILAVIMYIIYIFLNDTFIYKFKGIYVLNGGIKEEFDRMLIESFNNGESRESIITRIREKAEIDRSNAKNEYDRALIQPQLKSQLPRLTLFTTDPKQAKSLYNMRLNKIKKLEDLRISFVKNLISEKTFRNRLK